MRFKISAGVVLALALLIPAAPAPAVARAEPTGLDAACQPVARAVYQDIRRLITIDLDTATDAEVEAVATQIRDEAEAESLIVLPAAVEKALKGSAEDLRVFLRKNVLTAWSIALRISVGQTLANAGANVEAAGQKTLNEGTLESYLAYLNDGLYVARELDCKAQPTPTPTVKPSASTTVAPVPTTSASTGAPGGEGGGASDGDDDGGLPVTGADTAAVAGVGGALLLLGGAGYLIGRRRRSRFVA